MGSAELLQPSFVLGTTGERLQVLESLCEAEIRSSLQQVHAKGIRSLAVALLHSYTFPYHEERIQAIAREIGFTQISLSSHVMPMVKILPRASTSCLDAYLTPIIKAYLACFQAGFDDHFSQVTVQFMQSDGGLAAIGDFVGSKAILSGPAAGVIGYSQTSPAPCIGFDMGGTSTDVSRYAGSLETIYEAKIAGIQLQSPQLDITTVAAGGGSRLSFKDNLMTVGPESVGAHPGPACYRKGGAAAITDANVVLGRVLPAYFPCIFGPTEDLPLDKDASRSALQALATAINEAQLTSKSVEEVAMGFITVANEAMCRPIRAITRSRGYDPNSHTLACFGGAGPQHACAMARALSMERITVHRYSGILSAYGLALADVFAEEQEPCAKVLTAGGLAVAEVIQEVERRHGEMTVKVLGKLRVQGFQADSTRVEKYLHLRFQGTDTTLLILEPADRNYVAAFTQKYETEHGFTLLHKEIVIDDVRVRGIGLTPPPTAPTRTLASPASPLSTVSTWFDSPTGPQPLPTPVYSLQALAAGQKVPGPALVLNGSSTIVIEPGCTACCCHTGDLDITVGTLNRQPACAETCDVVLLSLFAHRFMSIAEQMGRTLQRTAISTNIKERLDYSCAVFGPKGDLVANAPHLPVHLGSMQEAVKAQIDILGEQWREGEVVLSNHPAAGGSHLPDITVITPVFSGNQAVFYVASRGHHADIGGISPGSMPPFSKYLYEEGFAVKSLKVVENGTFQGEKLTLLLTAVHPDHPTSLGTRALQDNLSDIQAQISANSRGIALIHELIQEYSLPVVHAYMHFIQANAAESVRSLLRRICKERPNSALVAEDYMDDGTPIHLEVQINQDNWTAHFDFAGTGVEVLSNLNAPKSVCKSAVIYSLRCLVDAEIPLNQGCLDPIRITIPPGSLLDPSDSAAVVGGNVLTSQRITDVIFKAFQACAASQGCMNNLTFGDGSFGYYETICGGAGAGPGWHGVSGVHTHMTNTRITDVEVMERRYPVLVREFSLRKGSGGKGKYAGGDGVIREIEFWRPMEVGILSERRSYRPYGLEGGESGLSGLNLLYRAAEQRTINVGAKNSFTVLAGDRVRILTPGGGGFGLFKS